MTEVASWGLIGSGNIGGELRDRLADPDTAERLGLQSTPDFIMRSNGLYGPDGERLGASRLESLPKLPDIVFVATPTTDDGIAANHYITHALDRGQSVVTAEKGAIANNFAGLRRASDNFDRLGISATVGGGTRLLHEAKAFCSDPGEVSEIHLVLNGTLAFLFNAMTPRTGKADMTINEAVRQAISLGYAEPGSTNPEAVIRAEAEGDIPKKVGIVFNTLGLSQNPLDWKKLKFTLTPADVARAIEQASTRRFAVSIYPDSSGSPDSSSTIGGFDVKHDGWRIVGGFRDITSHPALAAMTTTEGPTNGFVIGLGPNNSHGMYSLTGPGAGAGPTVSAMLHDAKRMNT